MQALRTQQIIAHETGVTDTVDPLGGSYFVETMTNQMEEAAYDYFRQIEDHGGVMAALESGFFQREIANAAYVYQMEEDKGERITVGVNEHRTDDELEIPLLRVDREGERRQIERLNRVRRSRDNRLVKEKLQALEQAARRVGQPDASTAGGGQGLRYPGRNDGRFPGCVRGIPAVLGLLAGGM